MGSVVTGVRIPANAIVGIGSIRPRQHLQAARIGASYACPSRLSSVCVAGEATLHDIFIVHAAADRDEGRLLYEALRGAGRTPFLRAASMRPDDAIDEVITVAKRRLDF